MGNNGNNRSLVDTSQQVSTALPAAAASASSASLDLGFNRNRDENVEVEIAVDLTTILVDTKDIDLTLQMSSDNAVADAFVDVPEFADPVLKVTSAGTGNPETKLQIRLPRSTERYIRVSAAVETGGGDVTGSNFHLRLLF